MDEEIYVIQPPGFDDGSGHVWRLLRALYALKQSANAWHKPFLSAVESIGYQRSLVDPAVFVRQTPAGTYIIHSHVVPAPAPLVRSTVTMLSCFSVSMAVCLVSAKDKYFWACYMSVTGKRVSFTCHNLGLLIHCYLIMVSMLSALFGPLWITRLFYCCLLYTSPSPRDRTRSRMPSSA